MHRDVLFAFFAALFFSVFVAAPAFADNRVALVIGNSACRRRLGKSRFGPVRNVTRLGVA